jgi:hypothetical protein
MDQMAARKLGLMLITLYSIGMIPFVWIFHLFVVDMEGVQYLITAVFLISIVLIAVFVRPALMNAPLRPPGDENCKELLQNESCKELPQNEDWRSTSTRKLILKRKKTYVGSVLKAYVFLGDGRGEFVIKGVKCTELGFLNNGGRGEYGIPEESVYVFVLNSKKRADDSHFCYQIPRGNKNVELFIAPFMGDVKFKISAEET